MGAEISNLIYLTIINLEPDTGGITDIVNIAVTEVDVAKMRGLSSSMVDVYHRTLNLAGQK